jgi:uncharacterized protein (DUF2147 family)
MKRIACLILLTAALSSPASARGSYSFVVHGHRVHIPAHCRSMSCVSVTNLRRHRDADDVATVNDPVPAPTPPAPLAPPPAPPPPAIAPPPAPPPVSAPPIARVAPPAPAPLPPITRAPPIPPAPIASPQPVQSRPSPVPAPTLAAAPSPPAPPSVGFEAPRPPQPVPVASAARPTQTTPQDRPTERIQERPVATPSASPSARVAQQSEDDDDSPIGDWQTEDKNGLVRIESCGEAFCGYMLNANTKAKGETVLVNMKLKKSSQWAGNVYSRASGNSYYGTMTLKEGNSLRVEACALGSFFCSGNTWTRFEDSRSVRPDLANSRQNSPSPRS